MTHYVPRESAGFDIIINGENRFLAHLELSAIASACFYKENYPGDAVQIRRRADKTIRTVLGHARLE